MKKKREDIMNHSPQFLIFILFTTTQVAFAETWQAEIGVRGFKAMQALNYLHQEGVYYGDMKPENLLVFKNY